MNFEVTHISRGDIRLKQGVKQVRALGEALMASALKEPSYVVYVDSLNTWEEPPYVALTETEKQDVISAIRKHFEDRGSVVVLE